MKKIAIGIIMIFASNNSFGQFKFGIKGGLNFSQIITNAGHLVTITSKVITPELAMCLVFGHALGRRFFST